MMDALKKSGTGGRTYSADEIRAELAGKQKKRIVAVVDDKTCIECLFHDGLDPDEFGMPQCAHDDDPDSDMGCRCVVEDELTIRMRAGGRKVAKVIGVALIVFGCLFVTFLLSACLTYCSIRFLEWWGWL